MSFTELAELKAKEALSKRSRGKFGKMQFTWDQLTKRNVMPTIEEEKSLEMSAYPS